MGVFAVEIPLQEFERAAQRLKGVLHHTELDLSATFSAMTGGNIYLKYENSQKTGSFKIRGASNKIAALVERGDARPFAGAFLAGSVEDFLDDGLTVGILIGQNVAGDLN